MRSLGFAIAITMTFGLAGCGQKSETTINGTVKFQNKPVYGGYVLLTFDDNNQAQGSITLDGAYSITTPFLGHAKIAVGSPKPSKPDNTGRGPSTSDPSMIPDPEKWFEIPVKYADPGTSGKDMTVQGGKNQFEIVLE